MEINEIISQLQDKFGNSLDITKITELFKGADLSKFSFEDIISKVKGAGLLGDLDGDGVQESLGEELMGKAKDILGGIFGGK